jgi:hypothetical protein
MMHTSSSNSKEAVNGYRSTDYLFSKDSEKRPHLNCLIRCSSTLTSEKALAKGTIILSIQIFIKAMARATWRHTRSTHDCNKYQRNDQTFQGKDANVLRATKLMRLFNEQLEAMAKLKRKTGLQRVVVEHLSVTAQATAGTITQSKREGERAMKNSED